MDMLAVDLTGLGSFQLGDPVVIWGPGLPVERLAASAGTVNYELLCQVTGRVPRHYVSPEYAASSAAGSISDAQYGFGVQMRESLLS
jgi:alanine racemase